MLTNYALLSEAILPADTAAMLSPYSLLSEVILPADTAAMLTPYLHYTEAILPEDTAAMLAPYLVTADIAGKLDISDTAAMLTPYLHYTEAILPADTAAMLTPYLHYTEAILPEDTAAMLAPYLVTADIAGKLDISDTAAMLLTYIDRSDTASMLTPYLHYTEAILPEDTAAMLAPYLVTADIAGKLDVSDTAAMLTPYLHYTEAILPADTAAMLTPYLHYTEAILPADTAAMLTPYINHNDTAAMLSPYLVTADIAGKLDISDTASMLTNYAQLTEVILPADTASMLTPYLHYTEAILPADTAAMLTNYALLSEANSAFNSGSGITVDGSNNIDLGGTLDAATVITTGDGDNYFRVQSPYTAGTSSSQLSVDVGEVELVSYPTTDYTGTTWSKIRTTKTEARSQFNDAGSEKSIVVNGTDMLVTDAADSKGLIYGADYSANYVDQSLVDKEYVVDATTGAMSVISLAASGVISGLTDITLDTDPTITLSAVNCANKIRVNNDGDPIQYDLPAAAAGLVVMFYDIAGGVISINPFDGTDTIYLNGVSVGAGDEIDSAGSAGNFIVLVAFDATRWVTMGRDGTWVDGGAN